MPERFVDLCTCRARLSCLLSRCLPRLRRVRLATIRSSAHTPWLSQILQAGLQIVGMHGGANTARFLGLRVRQIGSLTWKWWSSGYGESITYIIKQRNKTTSAQSCKSERFSSERPPHETQKRVRQKDTHAERNFLCAAPCFGQTWTGLPAHSAT